MKSLVIMLFGVTILAALSQRYYPVHAYGESLHYRHRKTKLKSDIFMIILMAWLICFSFLRTAYNDTDTYIMNFEGADTLIQYFERGRHLDWSGNPLSELYRDFIRQITSNYHIYFFFPAFINTLAVVRLLKKYSVSLAFSIFLFLGIGTYITFIAALKQSIAVSVLILAIPYAIDKKYVRFYLLVFLAMLFHTHAFLFALVPFLFEKPWGVKTIVFAVAVAFAMATYNQTLGAFMTYAQSLGANVAESEVFDGHSINIIRVAVYSVVPIMSLMFRKSLFHRSTREERLFVNMSNVSFFIMCIGLVEGANLYARMASYFELGTMVALPWILKKHFESKSTRFVFLVAGVLYFVYFLYEFGVSKSFGANYRAISLWQFIKSMVP